MCSIASASRIQISEPQCQPGDTDVFASPLNNFGPIQPVNGGGEFGFCNRTGQDWTSILIAVQTTVPLANIVCDPSNAFLACLKATSPDVPNLDYLYFVGLAENPPFPFVGIRNNERFTISLDCDPSAPGGCSTPPDWPEGTTFWGYGNFPLGQQPLPNPLSTPEPASLALLGAGIAAVLWRKKARA
jgi:hypothetical protein